MKIIVGDIELIRTIALVIVSIVFTMVFLIASLVNSGMPWIWVISPLWIGVIIWILWILIPGLIRGAQEK